MDTDGNCMQRPWQCGSEKTLGEGSHQEEHKDGQGKAGTTKVACTTPGWRMPVGLGGRSRGS